MKRLSWSLTVCVVVVAGPGRADTINLATGLDAAGNLITTGGLPDAHWTVEQIGGGTGPGQVVTPGNADWGPSWVANGPHSDWIARNANTWDQGPAP
jgi:hypothetical protein